MEVLLRLLLLQRLQLWFVKGSNSMIKKFQLPPPPTSYSQPQLDPHLTTSSSVPRINIGSNGSAMKHAVAPKEITPVHFITAATPLMSSFEEV